MFDRLAHAVSVALGSSWAFLTALVVVIAWAAVGHSFEWSAAHSLFINTATTISTFLMVFLLQNTQNKSSAAMQLKLDELLRAIDSARTGMVRLEDCTDEQLAKLQIEFEGLKQTAAKP